MFKKYLICLLITSYTYTENYYLASIYDLLQSETDITYTKCQNAYQFDYPELPVAEYAQLHPYKGTFAETFILNIPHGKIMSCMGWGFIFVGNNLIRELLVQNFTEQYNIKFFSQNLKTIPAKPQKISGKVVVLTRVNYDVYGHWLVDILGRLAMLEMYNYQYDWLYVPYKQKYIKETLELLGIDKNKIINSVEPLHIEADELIVPSYITRRIPQRNISNFSPAHPAVMYCPEWCIQWLREKFIPLAQKYLKNQFPKRIFISRKDASSRVINNEDEVFALFKKHGFERYNLGKLSFLEQVLLFHNAETIVSTHGSGLTNLIFCNPRTQVIEIFQNQFDSTFWNISHTMGLQHHCVTTQKYNPKQSWKTNTTVSLEPIKKIIKQIIQ